MKRINVLSKETFNKIAAGEVVERPFSVVKELIENSIDAGATSIVIEIEQGGQKLIRVTDNGLGIYSEDVTKAFLPHATSKINNIEDIYNINTLGFRGEALASIASVSKVNLKTKTSNEDFGTELVIEAGEIISNKDVACNKGTIIEVRDLFFNLPVRLKFLKSCNRESALISDIVNRIALSHSNIAFELINNKKSVLKTFATSKYEDTVRSLYGKKICENIISFEKHTDTASIHGYIGNSEISKGSRNFQSIFVNKRYIKNKAITKAVENAFKSFLMVNKFPFFILFIDIYPELIDINVHPTKSEIKFENEGAIFKLVFNTVHEALRDDIKSSIGILDSNFKDETLKDCNYNKDTYYNTLDLKNEVEVRVPIDIKNSLSQLETKPSISLMNLNNKEDLNLKNNKSDEVSDSYSVCENREDNYFNYKKDDIQQKYKKENCLNLNIIGQFHSTYILAQDENNLYIIDQHAAHEKVLFSKYKEQIDKRLVTSQILLNPILLELTPEDYAIFTENQFVFEDTGFKIENFGQNTITIREVPIILGKPNMEDLFTEILENIKLLGTGKSSDIKYDKIASLACKAAIKANKKLNQLEIEALLKDMCAIEEPFTCPHGRPTVIKRTIQDIEKSFKRIQ